MFIFLGLLMSVPNSMGIQSLKIIASMAKNKTNLNGVPLMLQQNSSYLADAFAYYDWQMKEQSVSPGRTWLGVAGHQSSSWSWSGIAVGCIHLHSQVFVACWLGVHLACIGYISLCSGTSSLKQNIIFILSHALLSVSLGDYKISVKQNCRLIFTVMD